MRWVLLAAPAGAVDGILFCCVLVAPAGVADGMLLFLFLFIFLLLFLLPLVMMASPLETLKPAAIAAAPTSAAASAMLRTNSQPEKNHSFAHAWQNVEIWRLFWLHKSGGDRSCVLLEYVLVL